MRELEADVHAKRIVNRKLKETIEAYRNQLRSTVHAVEMRMPREMAKNQFALLYNRLEEVEREIERCVWTFTPVEQRKEVPLKNRF